ncbi:MAG: hypothetical protein DMG74_18380 [Acidobacteria bacterium]|nr:MAG: hypothetical protein DMG74_18380 [Acidobacteriota bacterium]
MARPSRPGEKDEAPTLGADRPRASQTGGEVMKSQRGLGRVYQPKFRDRKTGEIRTSPTWWLDYYAYDPALQCRRKIRESANTTSKTDALKLLKSRSGDIAHGKPIAVDASRVSFADLQKLLLTDYELNNQRGLTRMTIATKRLAETFAAFRAVDITPRRVDAYVHARLATVKPATVHVELAALKRMFSLAVRQELLTHAPKFRSLHFENARTGFFERAEFDALLAQLPAYAQPVVTALYFMGWRIGEVLALTWSQVDFKAGTVRLNPGTILPWVFVRDDGAPIRNIRSIWRTACRAAGLVGKIPHDFRRTAVRNLERAGVPRSVAMKLTGHKTEAVYRRYAIVSEADQAAGVKLLAALHAHDAQTSAPHNVVPLANGQSKQAKQAQSFA